MQLWLGNHLNFRGGFNLSQTMRMEYNFHLRKTLLFKFPITLDAKVISLGLMGESVLSRKVCRHIAMKMLRVFFSIKLTTPHKIISSSGSKLLYVPLSLKMRGSNKMSITRYWDDTLQEWTKVSPTVMILKGVKGSLLISVKWTIFDKQLFVTTFSNQLATFITQIRNSLSYNEDLSKYKYYL